MIIVMDTPPSQAFHVERPTALRWWSCRLWFRRVSRWWPGRAPTSSAQGRRRRLRGGLTLPRSLTPSFPATAGLHGVGHIMATSRDPELESFRDILYPFTDSSR